MTSVWIHSVDDLVPTCSVAVTNTYTLQLVATIVAPGADVELYTATAEAHTILRDVIVDSFGATVPSQYYLYLTTGFGNISLLVGPTAANQITHLELRQALAEGQALHLANQTAAPIGVLITGYVFT